MNEARASALTLAIGAMGAALGWLLHMPLAFLAGPALAVSLAGLAGVKTHIAVPLRNAGFVIVGLTIGAMVTPDSLGAVTRWPIAFSLLAALTFVTPWAGRWLLSRAMGFDRDEAFIAAAPGHLALVVALADSLSMSITRPAVLASIRLLALTLGVPLAARLAGLEIGPGLPDGSTAASWLAIAAQLAVTIALIPLMKRLALPAPMLIAAMLVGAAGHLTQAVEGTLPQWVSQLVLVLMGSLIGTRFAGTNLREFKHNLGAGALVLVLTTGLALLFALPAAWLSGLPLIDILVGFAPGALETMVIVGAALGADPSFVAAAHVLRLVVLAVILTGYATRMARR